LDATAGTREIILQAKGYRPRRVKIAVNKNVENVYEIDLEKLPPKVDPKALEKEKEKAKQAKLAREKEKERERERERVRKLDARREKDKKDKVPPVLPTEDESARSLADPGPEPKKESLEMPEERGPQSGSVASSEPIDITREPVSVAHFLPLGIGQFYNRDYLLGTVFLGTQLYAGAVIVQANQDIQQAEDNEQAAIRRAQVDPTVTQEDLLAFSQAKQAFVKDKQERLNLALGAAAGTYVFGVLHALVMRPYILPATVSLQLQPTSKQGLQLQARWDF
jgi:hypothetical protein